MSADIPTASGSYQQSPDSPALIKNEPEDGSSVCYVEIKSEPEQWLNEDHEIKEEMAIGPTGTSFCILDINISQEPLVRIKTEPGEDPFKDTDQAIEGIESERPLQYEIEVDTTPVKTEHRGNSTNKTKGVDIKTKVKSAQRKGQKRDNVPSKNQNVNFQNNLPHKTKGKGVDIKTKVKSAQRKGQKRDNVPSKNQNVNFQNNLPNKTKGKGVDIKTKVKSAQRKGQKRDNVPSKKQNLNFQNNLPNNVRIITITQDGQQDNAKEPPPGPIVCETCMKVFKNKYNLIQHAIIHTGEKPFTCQVCQFKFIRKTHMQRHIKKIHPNFVQEDDKIINKNVKAKRRRYKPLTLKIFTCSSCDRVFKRQSHLQSHLLIHTGEKPYVCKICGKRFTEKGNLARHVQLHSGEKQFSCDDCDKRFSSKNNLIKHIQVSSGVLRHSLNREVQNHSSSKFHCGVCPMWFTEEEDLIGHSKFHSGVKTYSRKNVAIS